MVQILDSTLREGEQTPGVYFPAHAKLAIAKALDDIGVDIIEAGHPVVGQGVEQAIRRITGSGCKAQIAAHARTVVRDVDLALDCGVDFLGIFYCVSDDRLEGVFSKNLASAIDRIVDGSWATRIGSSQGPDRSGHRKGRGRTRGGARGSRGPGIL